MHVCECNIEKQLHWLWFCLPSSHNRNATRGNTWKTGEEVSAQLLALYQAYTSTHLTCARAAWDPNQQHLTKLFSFSFLIGGSICRWGVGFLISESTRRDETSMRRNTKWMHLLTNEIKPLHLHFPIFSTSWNNASSLSLRAHRVISH